MRFSAQRDVTAVVPGGEVTVLVELEAPSRAHGLERPGTSFQVVLDTSSPMEGAPFEAAVEAVALVAQHLDSRDIVGLVGYGDPPEVIFPAAPLTDGEALVDGLAQVDAGPRADLRAGLLLGLEEIRRARASGDDDAGGAVLLLVSGSAACRGGEREALLALVRDAHADGIVTSTLGCGVGYDEELLSALARDGCGNHYFARDTDAAVAAVASELSGLVGLSARTASLTVRPAPSATLDRLYNDLPTRTLLDEGVRVEVGDLRAEERRVLLMRFVVPPMSALGPTVVAELELAYVDVATLEDRLMRVAVTVEVVSGPMEGPLEGPLEGPASDPTVRAEVLYQDAQECKRQACEALRDGDRPNARRLLDDALSLLEMGFGLSPSRRHAELAQEVEELRRLREGAMVGDTSYVAKLGRASHHRQNRRRGRRPGPGPFSGPRRGPGG